MKSDQERIISLEKQVLGVQSDVKNLANNVVSNSRKLDELLDQGKNLNSKSDLTIQSLQFIRENHQELKSDFKEFKHDEYDDFKTSTNEKINKTNLSIAKIIGVAGAASTVVYGVIETMRSFVRGGGGV